MHYRVTSIQDIIFIWEITLRYQCPSEMPIWGIRSIWSTGIWDIRLGRPSGTFVRDGYLGYRPGMLRVGHPSATFVSQMSILLSKMDEMGVKPGMSAFQMKAGR